MSNETAKAIIRDQILESVIIENAGRSATYAVDGAIIKLSQKGRKLCEISWPLEPCAIDTDCIRHFALVLNVMADIADEWDREVGR